MLTTGSIGFICLLQTFYTSVRLSVERPAGTDSDHILMLWMGILALQLSFYYDNLNTQPIFPAYLQLLCFSLPIFSAPVFYFYIRSLSFGYNFKWKDGFFHLLPFVVFNILTSLLVRMFHPGLVIRGFAIHIMKHVNACALPPHQ